MWRLFCSTAPPDRLDRVSFQSSVLKERNMGGAVNVSKRFRKLTAFILRETYEKHKALA